MPWFEADIPVNLHVDKFKAYSDAEALDYLEDEYIPDKAPDNIRPINPMFGFERKDIKLKEVSEPYNPYAKAIPPEHCDTIKFMRRNLL